MHSETVIAEKDSDQLEMGLMGDGGSIFTNLCNSWRVDLNTAWPDKFGCRLRHWAEDAVSPKIRTISLFSGAGGLDIGFHDCGFDIVEMVEFNSSYALTLEANTKSTGYFGSGNVRNIDIRDYYPAQHGWKKGSIDFIIGGPPCQTFSAGGRRAGGVSGTTEQRGALFEQYVRLLKELKPKAFLFENVYGITGAEAGSAWQRIQKAFTSAGYTLFHRVLDAADYGVPQSRERMFIVGVAGKEQYAFPAPTHGPDSPGQLDFYSSGQAFQGLQNRAVPDQRVNGKYSGLLEQIPPGLNYSFFTEKMGHPRPLFAWRSKFSDFLYKADPTRPVRTIKAFCGKYTGPFHWESRRFAEDELKRLQTFPDNYEIMGGISAVRQQIGNSVPPQLARILAISVLDRVFGVHTQIRLPYLNPGNQLGFRTRKRDMAPIYAARAKAAIRSVALETSAQWKRTRTFCFRITDAFRVDEIESGDSYIAEIEYRRGSLRVVTTSNSEVWEPAFRVEIQPAMNNPWLLPVNTVELGGTLLDKQCYVGAWKAFEKWLSQNHFKDDLVQLNGYYAYAPKLSCNLDFENDGALEPLWKCMRKVVNGELIRRVWSEDDLAMALSVTKRQLKEILIKLRNYGYEVRSSVTNPQIPKNCFLIPYAFPTFTHRSVQFHKELF